MKAYRDILSSSLLLGIQQAVSIAVNIVQAKCVAIWLGAAATGVFGLYASLIILLQNLLGLGIRQSAVRYIAQKEKTPSLKTNVVAHVLSLTFSLGCLTIVAGLLLGQWSASKALGDPEKVLDATLIWIAAGLTIFEGAFVAILQGKRKIRRLTTVLILSRLLSALGSLILVYLLGWRGIAPAFLFATGSELLISLLGARKFIPSPWFTWRLSQIKEASTSLVPLGSAFMITGLMLSANAFIIRRFLIGMVGVEEAGWYQAAWTLTTFYCMMIMQAMNVDFLPRISQSTDQPGHLNQMVSEQIHVSILLAVPGLLFSMAFAPLIIRVLYSQEFLPAVSVARWMIWGMFFRVATRPLDFIPLAFNRGRLTATSQSLFVLLQVGITWLGIYLNGLEGVGQAFFISSLFKVFLQIPFCCRPSKYRFQPRTLILTGGGALAVTGSWMALTFDPGGMGFIAALVIAAFTSLGCLALLAHLTGYLAKRLKGYRVRD